SPSSSSPAEKKTTSPQVASGLAGTWPCLSSPRRALPRAPEAAASSRRRSGQHSQSSPEPSRHHRRLLSSRPAPQAQPEPSIDEGDRLRLLPLRPDAAVHHLRRRRSSPKLAGLGRHLAGSRRRSHTSPALLRPYPTAALPGIDSVEG
ncbi:hypothetical protein E2562_006549, partial [Oryza meyeriana var. granulata]